jgi:mraW methylase family
MTYYDQNALKLCHAFWRERLRPGMTCVDATAGRGRDAEVLCRLIGETGHLYAFDIQADAIESTRQWLTEAGLMGRATLIHASHRRMAAYVPAADAVVFNLG